MMHNDTLGQKIAGIHAQIKTHVGNVGRIGIALYNADSDTLSTFVHSSDGQSPLERYQVRLTEVPSLQQLHDDHRSRIIDDLEALAGSPSTHTRRILAAGYRSSYTSPLYAHGQLLGFLFFDSRQPGYFRNSVTLQLDTYAELISALISYDLSTTRALRSAVALTRELGRHRDEETAGHVNRVAHYTRSIGLALVGSDEDVEFLFQFAGLHDIGKIAIPDAILMKPGPLDESERARMQQHPRIGYQLLQDSHNRFIQVGAQIALRHHEHWNGKGYPDGLAGDDIPIEARIVTVADVFDALLSPRPYKPAWSIGKALEFIGSQSGMMLDPDCVRVLLGNLPQLYDICDRYSQVTLHRDWR